MKVTLSCLLTISLISPSVKSFSVITEKYFRFTSRPLVILQSTKPSACNEENSFKSGSTVSSFLFPSTIGKMVKFAGSICIGTSLALLSPIDNSRVLADARLNAPTSAGTRVNSDAESLLRYGLPISNKEIREIQSSVETAKMNLKTRRIIYAKQDVNNVKSLIARYEAKILSAVPSANLESAKNSLERLKADVVPLLSAIEQESAAGSGSLQERKGLDDSFDAQKVLSRELSTFEELMVPKDFKRLIPEEYKALPALQGRAEVEMTMKKPDGSQYDVDGKLYDSVKVTMVIDGYNAPLTGGNIVDLVNKGFYNGMKIQRSDGFVIQTGDFNPDGSVHGFVPKGEKEERKIPLEISVKGDEELLYGSTTEDDMRGYAATVLPFQSYGALGMARSEFESNSASSQFFWLLFESDLTPAGKNMLDGRYSCFGYTVDGADLLKDVKEGDVIVSAKVTKGLENLYENSL